MRGMARRNGVRTREALWERGGPCAQLAESDLADDEIAMHQGRVPVHEPAIVSGDHHFLL